MIRRAIGTTLAGLCALTGPLAGSAFATEVDPALTLSTGSARPGVAFTVSPAAALGCPAASGLQTVELFFTDQAGTRHSIGSAQTGSDGSWADAVVQLPVAGLDAEGWWSDSRIAAGTGTVSGACFAVDDAGEDPGDDEGDDPGEDEGEDPGDDEGEDPGDDPGDDEGEDPGEGDGEDPGEDEDDSGLTGAGNDAAQDSGDQSGDTDDAPATLTYPGIAFTVTGPAPELTLSAAIAQPGDSVTVTPGEGCVPAASEVRVAVVALNGAGDDASDDPSGLPAATVITSATGTWPAVTLVLPTGTATGDYAVTADCSNGGTTTSSYAAEPLALGSVLIGPAVCGARTAFTALTGTYGGDLAGRGDAVLPAKLTLNGNGPWKVKVRSATTGQLLASRTVACAKPQYELDVPKTGLSRSNKPRARVCNAGRAPVVAVLQLLKDKKYRQADRETLSPGECAWLEGRQLGKGHQARARVLIDAPGTGSDDVTKAFTVKRPRR